MNRVNGPDYYQLLNVSPDSEVGEIIQAYHNICDKLKIFPYASEEEISQINPELVVYKKAYNTLTNEGSRRLYDERLKFFEEKRKRVASNDVKKVITETSDLEDIIPFAFGLQSIKENSFVEVKANINEYLFSKAKEHLNNGEYHEAINLFRKLLNIKNEAKYHSYLALALTKKGWDAYANEEFKLALEIDPNDVIALEHNKLLEGKLEKPKATSKLELNIPEEKNQKISLWDKLKNILKK